jgi:hypothetical protein
MFQKVINAPELLIGNWIFAGFPEFGSELLLCMMNCDSV